MARIGNEMDMTEKRRKRRLRIPGAAVALIFLVLTACGCNRSSTTKDPATGMEQARAAATRKHQGEQPDVVPEKNAAQGQAPTKDEKSPVADPADQFAALRDDLVAGHWRKVAKTLPPSWRARLADGAKRWTEADPAVREQFWKALAACAEQITRKEEFIVASKALVIEGPEATFLTQHLRDLAEVTTTVARSLASQSQSTDGDRLIEPLVKAIAADPELVAALQAIQFETISRDGGTALLRYRSGPKGNWRTIALRGLEERWVPRDLFYRWPSEEQATMGDASALTEHLRRITGQLEDVQRRLANVATQQEFDQLIRQAAGAILQANRTGEQGVRPVGEEEFVWLIVKESLSPRERDQLLWNIAQRTDAPASAIADMRSLESESKFRLRVGPVADVKAFAERLTGLTIESIDEKSRTITTRLDRDRSP